MKSLLTLSIAAVLSLAACSTAAPATVDGAPISEAELEGLSSTGAVPFEQLVGDLFDLVSTRVALAAASSDFGIEVTDAEKQDERATIDAAITAQGTTMEAILDERGRTEDWVDLIITQTVLTRSVSERLLADAEPISDDDVMAAFDEQAAALTSVCARHILVDEEAAAQEALERAEAGENFAALATELSTGPSGPEGGDLGCAPPSNYVPEFADATMTAEIGVPFGPVQTEFGWHVILVESREEPAFEESEALIRESLQAAQSDQLYFEWLVGKLRTADVSVSGDYGTWDVPSDETAPPSIVPVEEP